MLHFSFSYNGSQKKEKKKKKRVVTLLRRWETLSFLIPYFLRTVSNELQNFLFFFWSILKKKTCSDFAPSLREPLILHPLLPGDGFKWASKFSFLLLTNLKKKTCSDFAPSLRDTFIHNSLLPRDVFSWTPNY